MRRAFQKAGIDSSTESSHQYPPSVFKLFEVKTLKDYDKIPSGYYRLDLWVQNIKGEEYSLGPDINDFFISCKKLQLIHAGFAELFLTPAIATALGLSDLLRFQVQELKLDVNTRWILGIIDDILDDAFPSLLLHALYEPDGSALEFLLSQEDLIITPLKSNVDRGNLFHWIPCLCDEEWVGDWYVDMLRVERILQKSKDVDLRVQDTNENTPLDNVCSIFGRSLALNARLIELAKLYLSHGARVTNKALWEIEECRKSIYNCLKEEKEIGLAERQLKQMSDVLNQNNE